MSMSATVFGAGVLGWSVLGSTLLYLTAPRETRRVRSTSRVIVVTSSERRGGDLEAGNLDTTAVTPPALQATQQVAQSDDRERKYPTQAPKTSPTVQVVVPEPTGITTSTTLVPQSLDKTSSPTVVGFKDTAELITITPGSQLGKHIDDIRFPPGVRVADLSQCNEPRIDFGGQDQNNIARKRNVDIDFDGNCEDDLVRRRDVRVNFDPMEGDSLVRKRNVNVNFDSPEGDDMVRRKNANVNFNDRCEDDNLIRNRRVNVNFDSPEDENMVRRRNVNVNFDSPEEDDLVRRREVRVNFNDPEEDDLVRKRNVNVNFDSPERDDLVRRRSVNVNFDSLEDENIVRKRNVNVNFDRPDANLMVRSTKIDVLNNDVKGIIDVVVINGEAYYLLKRGYIVTLDDQERIDRKIVSKIDINCTVGCERKQDDRTDDETLGCGVERLRFQALALFYSRLYGLASGIIYVLSRDTFRSDTWLWTPMSPCSSGWPERVIDITTTLNSMYLWITTVKGGYIVDITQKPKKITSRPFPRRYGNNPKVYVELISRDRARLYVCDVLEREYDKVKDACIDYEDRVHVLSTDEEDKTRIKIIQGKLICV